MLIRTWESERTISDRTLDEEAVITAKRTARASPMRADETKERETLRGWILVSSSPENRPPMPQLPVRRSQAASTWHRTWPGDGWEMIGGEPCRLVAWLCSSASS
ncbi:BnaC03g27040D [Brassica napus]|uniref:BnaC03g27040D protein n=1 Tax=Brassica napus TaxID=3708 RepID=A0A078G9S7_BRANA|nr:BnaC03g27040D [Brassica napus]